MYRWIVPVLYVLAVLVCLLIAFDFEGSLRSSAAWFVAVVLTLPWSIVSVLFMWSLIHGAGLELFTVFYLLFAVVNAIFMRYVLVRTNRKSVKRVLYGAAGVAYDRDAEGVRAGSDQSGNRGEV